MTPTPLSPHSRSARRVSGGCHRVSGRPPRYLYHLLFIICYLGQGPLLSCSSIDCPVETKVLVNYGIYSRDASGAEVADTLTDTLYVWTRRIDGKDTLLLNRGVGITDFSLQISYNHPEDTLIMLVTDTNYVWTLDTVWLKKTDIPHFESVDCAAHFFHHLDAVRSTHYGIDTISIDNPSVTYDTSPTNLRICFKNRH